MTEHEEARRLAFKRDMDALIFKAKQGRLSLGEQNDLGMMLSVWLDEHEEGVATPPGSGGSMTEHEEARRRWRTELAQAKQKLLAEANRAAHNEQDSPYTDAEIEHEEARRLVAVGEHECVTCHRCACTFARVHPACPRCSQEARGLVALAKAEQELNRAEVNHNFWEARALRAEAQLAKAEQERDAAIADCQTAEENARAALCRAQDAEDDLQTATQMLSEHGLAS